MITTELVICFLLVNIIGLGCFKVLLYSNINFAKKQKFITSWDKSLEISGISDLDYSNNFGVINCSKIIPVVCQGKYDFKYNNYYKTINIWRY